MRIEHSDATTFLSTISGAQLVLIDPPYFGIVDEAWDNQWESETDYVRWLTDICAVAKECLTETGSLLMFGGIGKHGSHPLFRVMSALESEVGFTFRNMITWKKRRAYGKSHDYLFCREEIVWYSVSPERTGVTFNIPLLAEKRGYAGFDPKHPAKSEFKRVSNVWDDIPELMRPSRRIAVTWSWIASWEPEVRRTRARLRDGGLLGVTWMRRWSRK